MNGFLLTPLIVLLLLPTQAESSFVSDLLLQKNNKHHLVFNNINTKPSISTTVIQKMSGSTTSTTNTSPGGPSASAFWDDKYSNDDEFVYGTEPNDFLKETVTKKLNLNNLQQTSSSSNNNKKKKTCLLLSDGEGRNGVYMAKQGFDVTSVDYSHAGLKKAESLATKNNVKLTTICEDLANFDFGSNKWDCIVGIMCHLPPPIRNKVLDAIPTSLTDDGIFILECYTPEQLNYKTGGPPVPQLMYSKQLLQDAFEGTNIAIERNEELIRDVVEGTLHTGTAAVVQFIGRKTTK